MNESKFISWLGRIASIIAILMYVSYIAQIYNNLHGNYAAPLQPFVAGVNCTLWSIYAYLRRTVTGQCSGLTFRGYSLALRHS